MKRPCVCGVVIAYSLTMATVIPFSGWLADKLGTRHVFFSAILIFTIGSLLCANAHSLMQLVIYRVVQGVGGAMLLPVGHLSLLRLVPPQRHVICGHPGADRTDTRRLDRADRLVALDLPDHVPVGVIGCIATRLFMTDSRNPATAPFDLAGYLLLAVGMAALTISLDGLADLGLQHAIVLVLLVLSLACVRAARRARATTHLLA